MPAPVAADLPVYVICSVPISSVPAFGNPLSDASGIDVTEASIPLLIVLATPAVSLFASIPPVIRGMPFVLISNQVTALVSIPILKALLLPNTLAAAAVSPPSAKSPVDDTAPHTGLAPAP